MLLQRPSLHREAAQKPVYRRREKRSTPRPASVTILPPMTTHVACSIYGSLCMPRAAIRGASSRMPSQSPEDIAATRRLVLLTAPVAAARKTTVSRPIAHHDGASGPQ